MMLLGVLLSEMRRFPQLSLASLVALGFALVPAVPARGATSAPVTLDALVASSDMVVYGRVVGGQSFWDAATRTIWTSTQIAVLDAPKGRAGATVLVTEPGGVVGDTGHLFPGVPRFAPNQEVVAFLYQARGDRVRVVGLWQGIYGVSVDPATGERLARPAAGQPETVYQELHLLQRSGAAPATRRLGELLLQIRERAGSR
jgi:hypothetical protein